MIWQRIPAVAALVVIAFFSLAGCTRAPATVAPGSAAGVPMWVRLVPPERDGRTLFVGGVSFAADSESGVAAAEADAGSQIELSARQRFLDRFNPAISRSGIETTAIERLHFKDRVTKAYAERMVVGARCDSVFYRACGDRTGGTDPSHDGGPVCPVFVLMTVGASDWDTVLADVLATEKRRQAEEGADNMAQFAEYLIRQVLEEQAQSARERSR